MLSHLFPHIFWLEKRKDFRVSCIVHIRAQDDATITQATPNVRTRNAGFFPLPFFPSLGKLSAASRNRKAP